MTDEEERQRKMAAEREKQAWSLGERQHNKPAGVFAKDWQDKQPPGIAPTQPPPQPLTRQYRSDDLANAPHIDAGLVAAAIGPAVKPPTFSNWKMTFAGLTHVPLVGDVPNWFHRLMARLLLGVRFERITII